MHKVRNFPEFTHFACLPFVEASQRDKIHQVQQRIKKALSRCYSQAQMVQSNYNLAHITVSMLILHRQQARKCLQKVLQNLQSSIKKALFNTIITFSKISYFTKFNSKAKKNEVTLIYLEIQKDQQYRKIEFLQDLFIRQMIKSQIIDTNQLKEMRIRYDHNSNRYKNQQNHLTLFRIKNVQKDQQFCQAFGQIQNLQQKIRFKCSFFDISTKSNYDQNNFYKPFQRICCIQQNQIQNIKKSENQKAQT